MKKRTHIDFSQHEIIEEHPNENVSMYHLKLPNTRMHSIRYINAYGVLAVSGDFGNWIFCREFHPGPKEGVSDGYWREKLHIASSQQSEDYDADETIKEIDRLILDPDWESNIEELKELRDQADTSNGEVYMNWAHENTSIDYEYIPYETKTKFWLQCVFDGFDEMCSRKSIISINLQTPKQ